MDMSILVDKRQREFGISKVDPNLMPGHTIDSSIIRIFQKDSHLKNHFSRVDAFFLYQNFYHLLSFWVSESVSESGLDLFDVSGSSGTWSTSSFSFGRPVELTDLGGSFLLDVVVTSSGGSAQGVGFVVSFTETGGTLSHF